MSSLFFRVQSFIKWLGLRAQDLARLRRWSVWSYVIKIIVCLWRLVSVRSLLIVIYLEVNSLEGFILSVTELYLGLMLVSRLFLLVVFRGHTAKRVTRLIAGVWGKVNWEGRHLLLDVLTLPSILSTQVTFLRLWFLGGSLVNDGALI